MNAQRFSLAALAVLGLMLAAGAAWGFMITDEVGPNRASEIVVLKGSSTTGVIDFATLVRVLPDGTEVPFTPGRVFRLIRFYFDFKTTSTASNVNVRLEPFLYPAAGASIVKGTSSGTQTFSSGCPVGRPGPGVPPFLINAVNPSGGATIPGTLNVNLSGIMTTPPATLAPIDLLLLMQ
jgi:hypothetical protein